MCKVSAIRFQLKKGPKNNVVLISFRTCNLSQAGPPLTTSEIMTLVSPVRAAGLSTPPETAIPNPKAGAFSNTYVCCCHITYKYDCKLYCCIIMEGFYGLPDISSNFWCRFFLNNLSQAMTHSSWNVMLIFTKSPIDYWQQSIL